MTRLYLKPLHPPGWTADAKAAELAGDAFGFHEFLDLDGRRGRHGEVDLWLLSKLTFNASV